MTRLRKRSNKQSAKERLELKRLDQRLERVTQNAIIDDAADTYLRRKAANGGGPLKSGGMQSILEKYASYGYPYVTKSAIYTAIRKRKRKGDATLMQISTEIQTDVSTITEPPRY